jgi:hypothetical protein
MALKECRFDAERALLMLRQFQSDAFDELAVIHRKRRRLEAAAKSSSKRHRHEEASSDSESDDDRRSRRKHSSSKHKKKLSKSKDEKHKRSKHKHKRAKRSRRSEESGSEGSEGGALEFGSFGIIREGDYSLKEPEFAAWASEVQHIDIESLPRCAQSPAHMFDSVRPLLLIAWPVL